jgi:ribulose-5-phosphate 4-epimerase/fuculose-1-phosphate aldolase
MCSDHGGDKPEAVTEQVADAGQPSPAAGKVLMDELVLANHILFDNGVVDSFGHVSARHDVRPDRFLLARNMAPGSVTADDIIEFDLDANPVNGRGRQVYLERFIHSEIYRARPDVVAVVHSHSHAIVPLGVMKDFPLRPLFHMAGFLGAGAPVFEIREFGGKGTDLLIRNQQLGRALAAMFRQNSIVLMRGHGSTVIAETLQKAVYRAVYAEVNARYQLQVSGLGAITYLTPEESEACVNSVEGQIQRPWDFWKQQAQERRRL